VNVEYWGFAVGEGDFDQGEQSLVSLENS
jgi:hypothetical protein